MTLVVFHILVSVLLAQATCAKMSTMKLKPPASAADAFQSAFSVGATGATTAQAGALVEADKNRYSNLLDQVSEAKIAPAIRAKNKRQAIASGSVPTGADQNGDEDVVAANNVVFYSIDVGVGTNEDVHELLIDTGSSNTWIGSLTAYRETSTSKDTGSGFAVTYGSGRVQGEEFEDLITIGNLRIQGQSIGVAQQATGFGSSKQTSLVPVTSAYASQASFCAETNDGILGIGPTGLTRGTLSDTNDTIPTVIDMLFDQGQIDDPVIGVYFAPSEAIRSNNGLLTFGGMDPALVQGNVIQAQRTKASPANQYWGVDMSFSLGDRTIGKKTAGITDTGTTLLMIAEDYFQAYVDLLSDLGGELDAATGLVRLPSNKVPSVPDMKFGLDAGTLSLVGDAQFFPESLNPSLGIAGKDAEGFRYSVTSTLGLTMSLDSWMASLERFTTGYNSKTGTINFGQTAFTSVTFSDLSAAITKFEAASSEEAVAAAEPSIFRATRSNSEDGEDEDEENSALSTTGRAGSGAMVGALVAGGVATGLLL